MLVLFAYVDYFLYLCRKYRLVSVDVGENRLVSKKRCISQLREILEQVRRR